MQYVRDFYKVPAKRGGRVEYTDTKGQKWRGTIRSARDGRLQIKLDGVRHLSSFHPTWNLVYLPDATPQESPHA